MHQDSVSRHMGYADRAPVDEVSWEDNSGYPDRGNPPG